jgi:hypothetical protein
MQIRGSMPLAGVSVTENGPNLLAATTVMGTNSLTSGAGSGDSSIVPMMTSFGAFRLTDTTVSTGGGFSIWNAGYGSFVATGGTIMAETANALVVDMTGMYTPGPLFVGLTARLPTPLWRLPRMALRSRRASPWSRQALQFRSFYRISFCLSFALAHSCTGL